MPCICEICQSIKAVSKQDRNTEDITQNPCYAESRYIHDYKPFINSKRTVKVTCDNFSHLRIFKAW